MDKSTRDKNTRKWVVVILVGVLALAAGIVVFISDKNISDTYTGTTTAIVTAYEEEEEFNNTTDVLETVYVPVVTYTVDGVEFTEKYSQTYSKPEYPVGEAIEIKYDPDAPDKFSIAEDNRGKIIAMWEIPVGIILIVLGIYQLIKVRHFALS